MKPKLSHDVDVMQDASEIVHYNNPLIPIYIQAGLLSYFPNYRALSHWHEDIELIYIKEGNMKYSVNGKDIYLKENDILIVNSKHMHYGYSNTKEECEFLVVLFHPRLLASDKTIYKNYVEPFINCQNIEYIHLDHECPHYDFVRDFMLSSEINKDNKGYELEFVANCYLLISKFLKKYEIYIKYEKDETPSDLILQKEMVSYIYDNYAEQITLEDIASSVNVSRSKCCQIFKQYLQQSPIDFIIAYRLEKACYLLEHSKMNISEIAIVCGFNSFSYFSKMFLRKYDMTPREYRKRMNVES